MIPVYKYHGVGNDFIILDQRQQSIDYPPEVLRQWCHRRFGIGADGVMYLRHHDEYDFEMCYFNSDGKPGTMCGNGGRCIVAFAADRGIIKPLYRFLAPDGLHSGALLSNLKNGAKRVRIAMQPVLNIQRLSDNQYFLDTGSPHLVCFVENLSEMDVQKEGRSLRYDKRFAPKGTNVCFVEPADEQTIKVRTFERGVEAETLACGTGAVASAVVAKKHCQIVENKIKVQYPGGDLKVTFSLMKQQGAFDQIQLEGMAQFVFSAQIHRP